jgi:UPF0716 protein FxsA
MGALLVIFILVPLLELYVLVQVAQAIGVFPALVFLAAVSIAGAVLVRRQGVAILGRIRAELDHRRMPTDHLADGALLLGAGVLLTVPGFVTDGIGLALLVPPVRRAVASVLRRRWTRKGRVVTATYHGTTSPHGTTTYRDIVDGTVIDIDTGTADRGRDVPPPQELPRP